MSWKTEPSVSLTAAKITLTLTLSLDYYPTVAVNDQLVLPGSIDFGDHTGTQQGAYAMTVRILILLHAIKCPALMVCVKLYQMRVGKMHCITCLRDLDYWKVSG